jgi:homoserine acetyltransferase
MAAQLPRAEFVEIDAPHGHDAFLIRVDEVNDLLVDFINRHNLKQRLRLAVNE